MKTLSSLCATLVLFTSSLFSFCIEPCLKGRIDAGGAYAHLEFQQERKTLRTLDLYGGRVDATVMLLKGSGICVKPFIFGAGGEGNYLSYGVGVGHYTPITDRFYILPVVGGTWSDLQSTIPAVPTPFGIAKNVREKFDSRAVYVGFETGVGITDKLWLTYVYQYVWADVKTTYTFPAPFPKDTSRGPSNGSNMAVVADYYVRPTLALTLGLGYNDSLDRNAFGGVRGWGVKLGVAWCFGR